MKSIHAFTAGSLSVAAQVSALLSVASYTVNSIAVEAGVVATILLAANESSAATVTVPGAPVTVPNYSYSQPQPASSSDLIYNWTGICAGADPLCLGSTATATLELINSYVPGQALNPDEIVSFNYSRPAVPGGGPALTLGLTTVGTTTAGALPVSTGNPPADFDLLFQTAGQDAFTYDQFLVNIDGSWDLGLNLQDPGHTVPGEPITFTFSSSDGNSDPLSSQFSLVSSSGPTPPQSVPEPGTLGLIGTGLAGLWFARRKTKKRETT